MMMFCFFCCSLNHLVFFVVEDREMRLTWCLQFEIIIKIVIEQNGMRVAKRRQGRETAKPDDDGVVIFKKIISIEAPVSRNVAIRLFGDFKKKPRRCWCICLDLTLLPSMTMSNDDAADAVDADCSWWMLIVDNAGQTTTKNYVHSQLIMNASTAHGRTNCCVAKCMPSTQPAVLLATAQMITKWNYIIIVRYIYI